MPGSMVTGNYTVNWVTSGDLTDPIYTPVKKTLIVVTQNAGNIFLLEEMELNDDQNQNIMALQTVLY